MARTAEQLFDLFAVRVAELLRERHRLDSSVLLRVRRDELTLEGLTRDSPGDAEWFGMRVTPEQLEWEGPVAMAEVFVREYVARFEAANAGRISWPATS